MLLQAAQARIRTTRSSTYWMMGDQFSRTWAKILEVSDEIEKIAACDVTNALDTLAESGWSVDQFEPVIRLTEVEAASRFLAEVSAENLSLETALKIEVATLAVMGQKKQTQSDHWLTLWRDHMRQLIAQQVDQCGIGEDFTPEHTNFEQAVEAYLTRFEHTSALALAVIGTYPFAKDCPLDELLAVMRFFNPLYRLAQDVRVDLKENINTGLYAFASEQRLSIGEAKRQIVPAAVQERLHAYSDQYMARANFTQYSPKIQAFSAVLLKVAQQLRTPWKGET